MTRRPFQKGRARSAALALLAMLALGVPQIGAAATAGFPVYDNPGDFSNAGHGVVDYTKATSYKPGTCTASVALTVTTGTYPVATAVEYPANGATPAFCDIQGSIKGTEGFEIAMPDAWNGRLYVAGNGGWAGEPMAQFVANRNNAVSRGFAYAHTNTGHWETGAAGPGTGKFAANDQILIEWAYSALHDITMYAKSVIGGYYGHAPLRSYFEGCSTGGRQALTEVQRFPSDFDGVIAGSPANLGTNLYLQGVWANESYYTAPFTLAQVAAVGASLLKRCGEVDGGVAVGLIADPRSCRYMPGTDGAAFTAAQNGAYERIITGAVNSQERISYGPALGSEFGYYLTVPPFSPADPGAYTPISMEDYASGFLQYLAPYQQRTRTFSMDTFNFNTDTYDLQPIRGLIDVGENPNLSGYAKRGGKVIVFHGWADPLIPTYDTVSYVENVWKTMGYSQADDTMRAFFVPGMGHCGDALGGYGGPDVFDMVTPLIDWVEAGVKPSSVVASRLGVNQEPGDPFSTPPPVPYMTRPLCAYPTTAKYVSGNPFQASSFACGPGLTGVPDPIATGASSSTVTKTAAIRRRR